MRVLLTGAAGFIGSHVAESLLARGDEVIAVDNFNDYYNPARKENNIKKALDFSGYQLFRTDIRDYAALEQVIKQTQPAKICHIAAMAGVRYSIQYPMLYEEVNVRGTMHIFELARLYGINQVVFASSSSVYGKRTDYPFIESDQTNQPLSPYAATKRSAELIGYTYHNLYNLKVTALRFFTVYGARNRPDMAIFLFTNAIDKGQPIRLFGDGSAQRDWTFVGDTVRGVVAAIDRPFGYEIINLGNHNTQTEMDLIHAAENALGKKALINQLERPPTEPPITYADITKAQKLLEFAPTTPLKKGYPIFFDWYEREGKHF